MLDHLFDKMMLLRIQTIQHNRNVLNICTEHQEIYDTIAQRNSEAAAVAIKKHLLASKERVIHEMMIQNSTSKIPSTLEGV